MNSQPAFSVSQFVAVFNQTLEYAYPSVTIEGELSNFRVSKNRWVYFDLKDDEASVRFFGTVYTLPGPLEDGMVLKVTGVPRLHPTFGFSVTAGIIQPVGEGTIKRAQALLQAKLTAEGMFAQERKRQLPYPPTRIGLITSGESAAYADFIKILQARWGGLEIVHCDVQVQGEAAPAQIVGAINTMNAKTDVDVLVVTRGGGSADDLGAFNVESVVRAVAGSRIPTLVAIGHEIDVSLAEMAADQRASTPSNAAELLVPDKQVLIAGLPAGLHALQTLVSQYIETVKTAALQERKDALVAVESVLRDSQGKLEASKLTLHGYDPRRILRRGYALVKSEKRMVSSITQLRIGTPIDLQLVDGNVSAKVETIKKGRL